MSNENNPQDKTRPAINHWADRVADQIIRERGDLDLYTCASGITPSGTVHIGNFREIMSVDLVVRALRDRGKNVRFIYSWDDYDVFRKVPVNMPDQDTLNAHLRYPITMVPDTTGRDSSYARHHEVDVESVLPEVGVYPEYLYQSQRYRANMYAEGMRTALQNRNKLKEILNRYRDKAHKMGDDEEYWPTAAFCCKCNKDTTEMIDYDGEYEITYKCTSCGHVERADLRTSKEIKLGWRVDWPMRWQFEHTVFEPAGKDHHSQGGSFDTARLVADEVYHWPAPVSFKYDFVSLKGVPGKMSSSKGKVINLYDVLNVYPPEIVRYLYAGTRPDTEFAISFDLDVMKIYEDYDKTERIAWGVDKAKNDNLYAKERRIYELSQVEGMPEEMPYQLTGGFRHLCNLLQTNSGDIDAVIKEIHDLKPSQEKTFRRRAKCAWYWITECAPEEFRFALKNPDAPDYVKAELAEAELAAVRKIYTEVLPDMANLEEKPLAERVYEVAHACGIEPKQLFTAFYQALIGKDQGPRLASFMKIVGHDRLEKILKTYL